METPFSATYYRDHYHPIQWAKYNEAWPLIRPHLPPSIPSMLDLGIGYGWWETFLEEQKIPIPYRVGVDVNEEAVRPRLKKVEYVLSSSIQLKEKFDLVVCWDAFHCFPEKTLFDYVKQNGLLLISEPRPFAHLLEKIRDQGNVLVDAWVGDAEKSRVVLIRKNFT